VVVDVVVVLPAVTFDGALELHGLLVLGIVGAPSRQQHPRRGVGVLGVLSVGAVLPRTTSPSHARSTLERRLLPQRGVMASLLGRHPRADSRLLGGYLA
jgi:hypothetical protein